MALERYEFFDYTTGDAAYFEFRLLSPIPRPARGRVTSVKLTRRITDHPTDQSGIMVEDWILRREFGPEGNTRWLQDRVFIPQGTLIHRGQNIDLELLGYISVFELNNSAIRFYNGVFEGSTSGTVGNLYLDGYDNIAIPGHARKTTLIVTIEDATERPTPLLPVGGENVDPSTETNVRFEWVHNRSRDTGFPQAGYLLQVSGDNINWTPFSGTTANQFAVIPLASLPSGRVFWRVSTIDTGGVTSDFSASQFFNIGTPTDAPTIITSIFTSSRPTIEWSTVFDQTAYQVQIDYNNINIIDMYAETAEQLFAVPITLQNNTQFIVRVRAKDSTGVFSAWAEDAISTDYSVPDQPSFIAVKKNNIVELTIDNPDAGGEPVIRNDIYRLTELEWIRIGTTQSETYYDWSAPNGTIQYRIVAVGASGETESDIVIVDYMQTTAVLLSVGDPLSMHAVRHNLDDRHTNDTGPVLMEFAGRDKPVAEFDEFERRALSLTYTTKSYAEYKRLEAMINSKSIMLYRDRRVKMYGVCTNVGASRENRTGSIYEISFVLSETEYDETVKT
jgi:hypothetical protein